MNMCHDASHVRRWNCGATRDGCFLGMVRAGLITPNDPTHSPIGDPFNSPLIWINAAGAAAVEEWVYAGAQND
jgi:hypothetical protein